MITNILHRRRLIFWLIRAYIKRRKRTIIAFFIIGIIVAGLSYLIVPRLSPYIGLKNTNIGVVGSYRIETLPLSIQNKMSMGLTSITESGLATPAAAKSYEESTDHKTYTFTLRDDLMWQDGKKFVAGDINYNFKDVQKSVTDDNQIVFKINLKDPYGPFPILLAQPLFRNGLIGLSGKGSLSKFGNYKMISFEFNGPSLATLTMQGFTPDTQGTRETYKFYANEEAAKTDFILGKIDVITDLSDNGGFENWKNVKITKHPSTDQLVTVFYNTSFPLLSDKNIRQALTYALPHDFDEELLADSPIAKTSWAYVPQNKFTNNIDIAKKLLGDSKDATTSSKLAFTITTTERFRNLAQKIKIAWAEIGVETNIDVVQTIPSDPQILLERFRIPADPDQYVLWHSTQSTNISHYSNPKIDKLLEDGRKVTDEEERLQIYADFQKYLVDDAPAAFLYYPTLYTITRK